MLIRNPKEIQTFLKEHRHEFDTPQCYLGTEPNTHKKDWGDPQIKLRILLVSCSRYEDFRGNQTIPLLYQMLNNRADILCDRAFFPNTEKEYKLFCKYKIPMFGLETKHSMGEYNVVMTSLSFLPPWTNFPLLLAMSGIPSFREERLLDTEHKYPIIMIGGSAMYGNFCVAYPVVDLVYLGDAEPGLLPLLDSLFEGSMVELQNSFNYIFVPSIYKPEYNGKKFSKWRVAPLVEQKLKIIRQKKLDEAPALTRPIPSFTDTTMGLGEIEISRGCRGMCAFCGIGWKYKPYRERSKEKMVELMRENRLSGGAITLCPIATEFAYYSEKQALISALSDIAYNVDPLSMRIDAFIDDPDFDAELAARGMNQLALGVEAPSQRLRNRLMKGITEKQILMACEIAIRRGFKRIKFFMISNIDEEWEDFEEFFTLLRKVRAIETDSGRGTRTGWDIGITCSWTPLFVEPCTPLQWKKPTIEQRKDWKKVDEILRGELKCKFKLGIKNSEDFLWTMQGMHLGDTRFSEALVTTTLKLKRPFYVSFTKSMKRELTHQLEEAHLDWSFVLRDRQSDEDFPWDIVDRGVTKKTLRTLYEKIVSGEREKKPVIIPFPVDRADFKRYRGKSKEVEPVEWYLLKYVIDRDYDVVPNTHMKALIHRAAYQIGFPLTVNGVRFFSDRDARNWYDGVDYFGMATQRKVTDEEKKKFVEKVEHMEIVEWSYLGGNKGRSRQWKLYNSQYLVHVGLSGSETQRYIAEYNLKDSVMVAIPSTRYFSGTFTKKKMDMREQGVMGDAELFDEFWRMPNYCIMKVDLGHEVGIRFFLKALFPDVAFSRILKWRVNKVFLLGDKKRVVL